ncbi:toll/interleukin-1 receptor domain-containing protein [Saccharopolyspora sp. NPDC003752]
MSQPEPVRPAHYNAFISYSHDSDDVFAPAFQRQLEAFARTGRKARELRVFRDDANLAADPDLWRGIERALATSEWLVVLASPDAAHSPWVGKEIEWWLEHRSPERILIGLTAGELAWDTAGGDFSRDSTAVHPALRGALPGEPRWIDLRRLRATPKLDDSDPGLQEAVAEFAAPLRGVEKDELIGEHITWLKRDRKRTRTALAVVLVLLLLAVVAGVLAESQRRRANEENRVATARLLAATAVDESSTNSAAAQLLAAEGYRLHRDQRTSAALFQTVNDNPDLVRQRVLPAPVTALAATASGLAFAGTTDGRLIRWDQNTGTTTEARLGDLPVTDVAASDDGAVAAATDGQRMALWRVGSEPVNLDAQQPGKVAVSPQGTTVVVLTAAEIEPQHVAVFDATTGISRGHTPLVDRYWDEVGMPDEATIALAGGNGGVWQRLRLADLSVGVSQYEQASPPGSGVSAASDDGAFTGFLADGWGRVFDTGTNSTEAGYSAANSPFTPESFEIRRDGRKIAASGGGELWLSDVGALHENRENRELLGAGGAQHVAFVGDSDRLITAKGATVSAWDPDQRPRLRTDTGQLTVPDTSRSSAPVRLAVSPDGRRALLVGADGEVVLHDLRNGTSTEMSSPADELVPAWLPDGTPAVIGRAGCSMYEMRGDDTNMVLDAGGPYAVDARITADGLHVVCMDQYGGTSMRRIGDGETVGSVGQEQPVDANLGDSVGATTISADGRFTAWLNGPSVTVNDTEEVEQVTVPGDALTVNYAGDRLLVGRADGSLDVRDASGANLIRTIPGGTAFARPLAWVPGTPFIGRLRNDGALVVIDIDAGTMLGELLLPDSNGSMARSPWEATAIAGAGATGELLTATPNGELASWAINEKSWLGLACEFAGRDLQGAEWREVTSSEPPSDLRCRR